MLDLSELFDMSNVLNGAFGSKHAKCPRPLEELAKKSGLSGNGVSQVLDFERLWASFVDDLLPIVGPGAKAILSGDWSGLTKDSLGDVLSVWKVWTRYRPELEMAVQQVNPFAKGGRGIDPAVSRAAQEQIRGYNSFRQAIAPTEEREKKGLFGRFKGWLTGKTSDVKQYLHDFDFDKWAETGIGQVATGAAAAGMVAAMSYTGDVDGYMQQQQLPERERFRKWDEVIAKYPGATRAERPANKAVNKLGYGAVIGQVPDGRVVYETAVSLWVVSPDEL